MPDLQQARATAVEFAQSQEGKPYQFGASGPAAFDCSGLTMRAWQAAGLTLPHQTVLQWGSVAHVDIGQALPGDLVFFGVSGAPHHVGLYVGPNQMIDAPDYGVPVGVHNYMTYGDVLPSVGRMPVPGDVVGVAVAVEPVASASPVSSSNPLAAAETFAGKLLNGRMWTRIGLGLVGVMVLFLVARWVEKSA